MRIHLASFVAAAALCLVPAGARAEAQKSTFLVTTTHTAEQCLAALDELNAKAQKLLAKIDWGCMAGDHTGYAFVSAVDGKAAIAKLPEINRATAKAVKVTKFTPEMLADIHKKMGK